MTISHHAKAAMATLMLTLGSFSAFSEPNAQTVAAPNEPLLYQPNIQYIGAFQVPNYYNSTDEMSFGGTAIAYNPAHNSLFIVGHYQSIAEISIPPQIVSSNDVNTLATSAVLQPWTQILPNLQTPLTNTLDGTDIGGLLVYNGELVGTDYAYYSGANEQTASHFVLNSLNLSTATVQGLFQIGSGGRILAGYMSSIPSEWQALLEGFTAITGLSDKPIIDTESSGPGAFGFDPSKLGASNDLATPFIDYPVNTPLGAFSGPANPMQSGTTVINGVVFVPGTSSVLYFGTTGTNYEGYGVGMDWGANNWNKGPQSLNGQYAFQVWAYNANDLVAVKQGTLQPWQILPYDVWNFTIPIVTPTTASGLIGGVAFDPASGRIYLSIFGGNYYDYSSLPLIEVFQVNMPTGAAVPAAPQIGTLAATPFDASGNPLPDAVPNGTPVTLTAGNIYAITSGAILEQVAFYLDTNNDGVLETDADQLLGYGTAAQNLANGGSSNWILNISTTSMTSGTYTIFAQAVDSNGLLSNPISTTIAITGDATTPTAPASASIIANPASGVAPLSVNFTVNSVGGTPPITFAWNFGDGAMSTVQNPSHSYTAAGTYTVTLTASNQSGSAIATETVTVTASPSSGGSSLGSLAAGSSGSFTGSGSSSGSSVSSSSSNSTGVIVPTPPVTNSSSAGSNSSSGGSTSISSSSGASSSSTGSSIDDFDSATNLLLARQYLGFTVNSAGNGAVNTWILQLSTQAGLSPNGQFARIKAYAAARRTYPGQSGYHVAMNPDLNAHILKLIGMWDAFIQQFPNGPGGGRVDDFLLENDKAMAKSAAMPTGLINAYNEERNQF